MSHTKDRLTASEHQGIVEVRFDSGRSCAIMACKTKDNEWADAQRLALCWNSHEALVRACQCFIEATPHRRNSEELEEIVHAALLSAKSA